MNPETAVEQVDPAVKVAAEQAAKNFVMNVDTADQADMCQILFEYWEKPDITNFEGLVKAMAEDQNLDNKVEEETLKEVKAYLTTASETVGPTNVKSFLKALVIKLYPDLALWFAPQQPAAPAPQAAPTSPPRAPDPYRPGFFFDEKSATNLVFFRSDKPAEDPTGTPQRFPDPGRPGWFYDKNSARTLVFFNSADPYADQTGTYLGTQSAPTTPQPAAATPAAGAATEPREASQGQMPQPEMVSAMEGVVPNIQTALENVPPDRFPPDDEDIARLVSEAMADLVAEARASQAA